ncbi:MAG TPA: tRNA uridine(34) 5-carboxymethylaminomethyl modification radical SAM/GNAT enzyme Elp3 [Candidatus Saccharimonadales bacterium]|nr:tRNA uridine(34) 5-carboxymethylaminomethyl modification radical SAM/GNAT enzyme Elp3 [Candidatus Saccharimonadales bacterium]
MVEAIKKLIVENLNILTDRDQLEDVKRAYCREFKISTILNSDIFRTYRLLLVAKIIKRSESFENLLRKRTVRTLSGIAPVAVLTKAYPCPGTCAYCPHQENVPVSYLSNEPAVMRAIRCQYDPYKQVVLRLKALENNGHEPEKIEIIVIGGTWSYLPQKYKYWYIANCFRAANDYARLRVKKLSSVKNDDGFKIKVTAFYKQNLSLFNLKKACAREQTKNENARYRIIGLTLETRPDYINKQELIEMREFGCTRVEMGVQALDDDILKLNKRGHGVYEVVEATKLLKEYGFKITYHIMPALPGATPAKDLKMFKMLFTDERFQPDQIKFYPTVVIKGSLLYEWYLQGKYKPYSDKILQDLIVKCKAAVPEYVRIIRLIRDIPGESIVAGNKITNLRQVLQQRGVQCHCIRCREVKDGYIISPKINIIEYPSSGGREFFLSADSRDHKTLYGFCRLRIDAHSPIAPAIIRELHVYGKLVSVGGDKKVQHSGLGRQLLAEAEKIAKENKIKEIAVISGVGVRGYYKKFGYKLQKTYMVKKI